MTGDTELHISPGPSVRRERIVARLVAGFRPDDIPDDRYRAAVGNPVVYLIVDLPAELKLCKIPACIDGNGVSDCLVIIGRQSSLKGVRVSPFAHRSVSASRIRAGLDGTDSSNRAGLSPCGISQVLGLILGNSGQDETGADRAGSDNSLNVQRQAHGVGKGERHTDLQVGTNHYVFDG